MCAVAEPRTSILAVRIASGTDAFHPSDLVELLEEAKRWVRAGEIVEATGKSADLVESKVPPPLCNAARRVQAYVGYAENEPERAAACRAFCVSGAPGSGARSMNLEKGA